MIISGIDMKSRGVLIDIGDDGANASNCVEI